MPCGFERVGDLVEAMKSSDEGQILAIADLIRMCECSRQRIGPMVTEYRRCECERIWIERKSRAERSVRLLLRRKSADKFLVVERRDRRTV